MGILPLKVSQSVLDKPAAKVQYSGEKSQYFWSVNLILSSARYQQALKVDLVQVFLLTVSVRD